jgi:Protein of unknown function (DUF3179)
MWQTSSGPNAESFQPGQVPVATGKSPVKVIARVATIGAIFALSGFVAAQARSLWNEWNRLQAELGGASKNQVIGYLDIAPVACYADGPNDWFRTEGDESLLWAKWEDGVGHQWFHFHHGDLDRAHLSRPKTIFVSRPIDYPVIETGGGEIWQRIPPDSQVVGYTLLGLKCVYPLLVLSKVQVVNDIVHDHPFLVVDNAFAPSEQVCSIFDASLNGQRVTMAATGYFQDSKPVLWDRGTKSLWVEEDESLTAVTGEHRGLKLPRIGHPAPVTWKAWISQNQSSRLLVGADRTHGVPDR